MRSWYKFAKNKLNRQKHCKIQILQVASLFLAVESFKYTIDLRYTEGELRWMKDKQKLQKLECEIIQRNVMINQSKEFYEKTVPFYLQWALPKPQIEITTTHEPPN